MKITDIITEAASPAQQAAIAISMKKAGKKPRSESVTEMDKSQTPPGRDGGDSDSGKKEHTAKPTTAKKTVKDAEKVLNKELNKKKGVAEGLGKDIKRLATGKDVKSRAGQEIAKSQDASMKGDTKTSKKHFDRYDRLDKLANKEQDVAEGSLNEFAPAGSSDRDDGFSDETLKKLAAQWYNGDEDPRVERTLMAAGWEIGQDENYDNGGVFVVQSGDEHGRSYLSWPAEELQQGVEEGSLEEVSLDLAKRARDKAEYYVDMDYDDMRDRPEGYSEKQRSKFQRYIDRKEPRAKGDRDWDPPKQGVAEHTELAEEFDLIESIVEMIAEHNGVDADVVWADLESLTEDELYVFAVTSDPLMESEAWQKANKRDRTDGMSQKAVNTYRREHPGSKLKTAVTTKPSKLKKGSKASKRRKSYCSRSRGQMKMHSISCAKTPDKAICKARRRWNC